MLSRDAVVDQLGVSGTDCRRSLTLAGGRSQPTGEPEWVEARKCLASRLLRNATDATEFAVCDRHKRRTCRGLRRSICLSASRDEQPADRRGDSTPDHPSTTLAHTRSLAFPRIQIVAGASLRDRDCAAESRPNTGGQLDLEHAPEGIAASCTHAMTSSACCAVWMNSADEPRTAGVYGNPIERQGDDGVRNEPVLLSRAKM